MAYWYEDQGFGIFQGQQIDRYQLLILFRQGVSYVIVRGE